MPTHVLAPFLATLASFVQYSPGVVNNKRDIGVQCLEALLARPECRKAVWVNTGIIHGSAQCLSTMFPFLTLWFRLVEILKHKPSPQMSYQVAFCFWLLSFEQDVAEQIDK